MRNDAPENDDDSVVKFDIAVKVESRCGNTIVVPSLWGVEDEGDVLRLTSSDGHARITVLTFTVEGSVTFSEFQDLLLVGLDGEWEDSVWTDVDINGNCAKKKCLYPTDDDAPHAWNVYALRSGEYLHGVLVQAEPLVLRLNGGFYEELVRSFQGCA